MNKTRIFVLLTVAFTLVTVFGYPLHIYLEYRRDTKAQEFFEGVKELNHRVGIPSQYKQWTDILPAFTYQYFERTISLDNKSIPSIAKDHLPAFYKHLSHLRYLDFYSFTGTEANDDVCASLSRMR